MYPVTEKQVEFNRLQRTMPQDPSRGAHITTYHRTWFYPMSPRPEEVFIEDIAHALSLTCRGNGHVTQFFSVAQHCLACAREARARGLSRRVVLACLLHDACESYLSDLPRPFKQYMPEYVARENHMLDMILVKYLGSSLTEEEQQLVKQVDDDLLWFDLKVLLSEEPDFPKPQMHTEISHEVLAFSQVEEEYLDLFYQLYEKEYSD